MKARNRRGAIPANRSLIAFGLTVLVLVASIGLYSFYYELGSNQSQTIQTSNPSVSTSSQSSAQGSTSQSSTSTTFVSKTFAKGNFSASTSSTSGLRLTLSMNALTIRMYDKLEVRAEEVNTSPQSINVTAADKWATRAYGQGGVCGSPDLVGIAIFGGNYTKDNLPANGGQLSLTAGVCLPAGYYTVPHSYLFQPQSAFASEAYECKPYSPNEIGSNPCTSISIRQAQTHANFSISRVSESYSSYRYLSPGNYTLAGVDEWGAIAILHFEVASPGCPFPRTGELIPPFTNMMSTVNGSWTFQLELNSTFVFRDQGFAVSATLTDSNLTDAYFPPHVLVSRPFPASLQIISPSGKLVWNYPPTPRTTLTEFIYSQNGGLDITNKTMSLLQSNQTYVVVAKPALFIQPDQPFPTGVEIRMSLMVC